LQNGACSREKELQKGANRKIPVKLTIIHSNKNEPFPLYKEALELEFQTLKLRLEFLCFLNFHNFKTKEKKR
jgi:hypothetical protein